MKPNFGKSSNNSLSNPTCDDHNHLRSTVAPLRRNTSANRITYPLNESFLREHTLTIESRKACVSIRSGLDAGLSLLDFNHYQMSMLVAVLNGAATSLAEISELFSVDPSVATRALDRLDDRDLIKRLRNQTDRRMVQVSLTPAGEQTLVQLCEIASHVLDAKLRRFSKIEFERLAA